MAQENPIGLAVGSIALGFVAGMLIPSTRVEDEKVGPVADQVKDSAKETGQEALERGKEVAQEAAQSAKETVQERGGEQAGGGPRAPRPRAAGQQRDRLEGAAGRHGRARSADGGRLLGGRAEENAQGLQP